eukprot:TRINITY_DN97856_c0_g1_i1.p1 TRINITY_DN97856_c0_g1~~TRINITY_DN97856_c0_g1_i1.p1  ORF type:complete len:263 (-),score=50.69 TRINITY_DN97856_c0_g1_i1:94-882(-)
MGQSQSEFSKCCCCGSQPVPPGSVTMEQAFNAAPTDEDVAWPPPDAAVSTAGNDDDEVALAMIPDAPKAVAMQKTSTSQDRASSSASRRTRQREASNSDSRKQKCDKENSMASSNITGPFREKEKHAKKKTQPGHGDSDAESKRAVKEFVQGMIKGQQLVVLLASGEKRQVLVSINKSLDKLKIQAKQSDTKAREIPLSSIDAILLGKDVTKVGRLESTLDETAVGLSLSNDQCIVFTMPDLKARDTLALCLGLFSDSVRKK